MIVMPICYKAHWTWLEVDINKKIINHYDSCMKNSTPEYRNYIYVKISNILNKIVCRTIWKWVSIDVYQQDNDYDCGVYVCGCIDKCFQTKVLRHFSLMMRQTNECRDSIKSAIRNIKIYT